MVFRSMEWHMNKYTQMLTISLATMLVGGCSSIDKYNPFTENKPSQEISRTPANSTEYLCEGNKRFYVRLLDKGNGAWLIYPDREVNLDKVGGSGSRADQDGRDGGGPRAGWGPPPPNRQRNPGELR